jgi:ABC-2 type transport system permease protein
MFMLAAVFVLFGIMNPGMAKLTPFIMESFADSLAQTGVVITEYEVTAFDSWLQFFKNIPMALIVFVLAECGIFTREYNANTLVLCLTKGLSRPKVMLAKTAVLLTLWTALYFICFGITYAYSAYFWDNSVICSLGFSVFGWWLLGTLAVMLVPFFSAIMNANTGVALGVGAVFGGAYLIGIVPALKELTPAFLMKTNALMYGQAESGEYVYAVMITALLCVAAIASAFPIFNKKQF